MWNQYKFRIFYHTFCRNITQESSVQSEGISTAFLLCSCFYSTSAVLYCFCFVALALCASFYFSFGCSLFLFTSFYWLAKLFVSLCALTSNSWFRVREIKGSPLLSQLLSLSLEGYRRPSIMTVLEKQNPWSPLYITPVPHIFYFCLFLPWGNCSSGSKEKKKNSLNSRLTSDLKTITLHCSCCCWGAQVIPAFSCGSFISFFIVLFYF